MLSFDKYHGAGNDFIMIDNRDGRIDLSSDQIASLCDRRFGIGADGLILLEAKDDLDFSMKYYNSDGYEGSMCGNGGRCIIAFAHDKGIISSSGTFNAIDGLHIGEVLSSSGRDSIVSLQMANVNGVKEGDGYYELNTGSPHYVAFTDKIDDPDFVGLARGIRNSVPYIEEGINVNFAWLADDIIRIRTFERGVENETLSCGTGVTATAIADAIRSGEYGNYETEVQSLGGLLKVSFHYSNEGISNIWLEGPTKWVYSGKINPDEIS